MRRILPSRTSGSSTRRTALRSADQKCSRHLLYSPDTEYFESARSKMPAPSSSTEAWREPPRKSSSSTLSDSVVMSGFFRRAPDLSVTDEHSGYRSACEVWDNKGILLRAGVAIRAWGI